MTLPVNLTDLTRRHCLALIGAATVSGCGPRGSIAILDPAEVVQENIQRAIVATSRAPVPAPEFFSGKNAFSTQFARFDVAVPPDRPFGTIRYPRGHPDPRRDFVVTRARRLAGPLAFVQEVNAAAASTPHSRVGAMFIHGFNNNFAEALMRHVQLRHDLAAPGVGVLFSWPTAAKLLAYAVDREHALFSRDSLVETMQLMRRTRLSGYNLIAHSMGAFVAMEGLRTLALMGDYASLRKIDAVVLISADLEVDLFRRQAEPVLAAGVPIYLLVSSKDKALRWSATLRGATRRVGSTYTREELGGLDVGIIDLSAVNPGEITGHLKVGSSPELIALVRRMRQRQATLFGREAGLLDAGATVLQGAAGLVLAPLSP
ncbi:alpha/beta hydrolase [Paracoccus benzoatiresistens]|uniref:Alpha/beta hydrolase n=1 Tax=Paracoccus benzoatiresistens TaxID=2997341 RepID=A0ABT4JBU3_9RHOB|nr:alpha/beta hydrolase [Paracoccus sp. EF6]MCZ0964374.1 alpha/beta hydrolase [Paracoccus sp. EF6]